MIEEVGKSDRILEQLHNHISAGKIVEVDEERVSFLIFQIGECLFSFRGSQVRELLPFIKITWIPGATALFPGVINVRGDVVAVIDLKQVLDIDTNEEPEGGFFVIVRAGDGRNGILVNKIVDVVEVSASQNIQLLPSLEERFKRFAVHQFEYDHAIVTVLDTAWIIEKLNS